MPALKGSLLGLLMYRGNYKSRPLYILAMQRDRHTLMVSQIARSTFWPYFPFIAPDLHFFTRPLLWNESERGGGGLITLKQAGSLAKHRATGAESHTYHMQC